MTDYHQVRKGSSVFSRRHLLRASLASALTISPAMRVWTQEVPSEHERFLVTLQLDGGVDVTMFCDPKVNVAGEPKINHWAESTEPDQVGGFEFAPVAENRQLFERYGGDTLVINGVDAQTNSHETGKLFNWTGNNSEGQPSVSALFAAAQAPSEPLAYSVFGGVSRTAGIIGYNRFDGLSVLRGLTQPNIEPWSGEKKKREVDIGRAQRAADSAASRLLQSGDLSVRQRLEIGNFSRAREARGGLRQLGDLIPTDSEIVQREDFNAGGMMFSSNLKQQMQSALLVFQSGLGVSADLALSGFDSHEENEPIQVALLSHLYEALNYFWETANSSGLADRILLVIGSDFSRTNFINEGNGKDHWPIGSYLIMEQGALWGNRVVGSTDELHFARKIDRQSLQQSSSGVTITPTHVHRALREYLGIEDFAADLGLGMADIELLPFFDSFASPAG